MAVSQKMVYNVHAGSLSAQNRKRKGNEWYFMKSSSELRTLLRSVDHKSYPAYKSLAGSYQFGNFMLFIDHVQGLSLKHI